MDIQKSTPGHIRSLLLDDSQPTLFLGAGASVTSGIPGAGETVEKAARWAWCQANGRSPEDIRVMRSDYWPWLCQQPWFSEGRGLAEQYPAVIGKLLGVKKTRRIFFEKLIAPGIQPSIGYRSLAKILNEGWLSTVLTTNFDHCLDDARIVENKPHLLVSIKTTNDFVRFSSSPSEPQLIYLHGSVEHYSDKNLDDEVASLDASLVKQLEPLLRDHPIVVVGYRGAEPSIMKSLLQQSIDTTNSFAQGVYWCVREADIGSLTPMLQEFAHAIGSNFQIVPIKGFDELLHRELWNPLVAAQLPPRRRSGFRLSEIPHDMKPLPGTTLSDLDSSVLFARLTQYAKRLGIKPPDSFDQQWLEWQSRARNLLTEVETSQVPTLAGWLLFARSPQTRAPGATVSFRAKGPSGWISRCFGDDASTTDMDASGNAAVEQEISGTLWAQLDTLNDLLSLVNQGFRLKEEESRTVYPFAPIAIKEVLVNALVHRDYDQSSPVTVLVEPGRIEVVNPGGLVAEVKAHTEGRDLEDVIAEGARGIKGYRNPVISDLFYGGGQMDRQGSGLSDVMRSTANNNGRVHFGPEQNNTHFKVVLIARPEAVDEITNTAIPMSAETVRYAANLLPFGGIIKTIWHSGTSAKTTGTLFKQSAGLSLPPGYVQDGRFFTLYDLASLAESNVTPFDVGDIEELSLDEVLRLPNGENIVLKLLNDAVGEHLRTLGLYVEFKRRRAYFPKTVEGERKITYKGRVKRSTRTVVKARLRRDSVEVSYYEHKALSYSVVRYGSDWALTLTPGYAFTRDGEAKPIGRDRTTVLSTRRAARDFNLNVHNDVTFWAATISEEANGLFALRHREGINAQFAPTILLSGRLPTVAFNAASFGPASSSADDADREMTELEDEIAELAEQEELEEQEDQESGNEDGDGN